MNYKKHYLNLVNSRKLLNREKFKGEYFEKHHILPKCFGGTNSKDNLVLLTAREHFIAHLLLIEMYEGKDKSKMTFAFFRMTQINFQQKRLRSSRAVELAKKLITQNCSGSNSSFFGKTHSAETREKTRIRMLTANPQKGKVSHRKGTKQVCTEEQRKNLSEAMKKVCSSEEHRERLRQISINQIRKPRSEETKKKISNNFANKTIEEKLEISNKIKNGLALSPADLERRRKISEARKKYRKSKSF